MMAVMLGRPDANGSQKLVTLDVVFEGKIETIDDITKFVDELQYELEKELEDGTVVQSTILREVPNEALQKGKAKVPRSKRVS